MNILTIDNLTVAFKTDSGEMEAVKNVDLKLKRGEVLALVGESGCGKTVLCKSMLHLLCQKGAVKSGEVFLDGKDLISASDKQMEELRGKELSMIFQDPMTSLNPSMSIGKQISEVITMHEKVSKGDAKQETLKILELVGIDCPEKRFNQHPHEFSGGMRQRVAVAIALAGKPKVLLADEPTTALDANMQDQILKLLNKVKEKTGVSIIFITHDLSLVETFADRVAVMFCGEIVEEGTVEEIYERPCHDYTKRLLRYANYGKGKEHTHGICEHTHGQPILEIKDITVEFPLGSLRVRPLSHISMEIHKGEILGIVGPSGCGKSTLAKCIMGIYKPLEGSISYFGKRKQIIFQDSMSAFNPKMTLEEIISEPMLIQGKLNKKEIRENVLELLEKVELEQSLLTQHPYEVSGGQRQRAAIARSIALKPDLLIADEPIASLDVSIQAQIVHLFRKLQEEEKMAIILISHDLPMVEHVSDRIFAFK